jgi:hypothetical protein
MRQLRGDASRQGRAGRDGQGVESGRIAKPGLLFAYAIDDLQFDDQGRIANSAALVEKLQRTFPEQFGWDAPQQIDAGAGAAHRSRT